MRIGFIDADLMDKGTRHPNLALMKIAGFYRTCGHEVSLIYDNFNSVHEFDKIFISKVFTFSQIPNWVLKLKHVYYGGTGFFEDGGENLPDEIEHHMPFYDLYKPYVERQLELGRKRSTYLDYLDYSIGFTSRGCFRKCEFCVNKKYDHAFLHSPVKEFYDESRPYIYLWDDNILALPTWEDVLDDIEATGRPFQFRQGIDLRLMTDKKAKKLVNSHYQGDFIFAFDHIEDKDLIIEKVQLWRRHSTKICKMYVIAAYKSQDETDILNVFERIHTLMQYGSIPYIMRFEAYKCSPFKNLYTELARWCNQPNFFKKKSFRDFCIANQEYKKDKSSNCSAYQAMLDFEMKFPLIAAKYFDLRFDQESIYMEQYGYGRKYANKPLCKDCRKTKFYWDALALGTANNEEILQAYFTKELDLDCLRYKNAECTSSTDSIAKQLLELIQNTPVERIIELIALSNKREKITKENIPQISDVEKGIHGVVDILWRAKTEFSFEDLGYYLQQDDKKAKHTSQSDKKYGENHAKLATLLDLAIIRKNGNKATVKLSQLGKMYVALPSCEQVLCAKKLLLRIPIIQNACINKENKNILDLDMSILSNETQKRRRQDVEKMVQSVLKFDN